MMWVFVGLALIELLVVHLLLLLLANGLVAMLVSVVSVACTAWLVWMILSMKRLPVTLDEDLLLMRVGTLRSIAVPTGNVAGLRTVWDGAALKNPGVAKLSLIAYPNVVVDLHEPLSGVCAIAHRLDDPGRFAAAIDRVSVR